MARCQAKRGFFALRDCDQGAATQCRTCHRRVCPNHLSQEPQLCIECYGKQQESVDHDDRGWFYNYRHNYYRSYGYSPLYFGHRRSSYYDDYDVRSFDHGRDPEDGALIDDDAGDFYDS